MKVTEEKIEISEGKEISWDEVESLRIVNHKLALVLSNQEVVELHDLRPSTIDMVFRFYEDFLKKHPEKRRSHA